MSDSTAPYRHPLGNGLILKSARDAQDAERVFALSGRVFGPDVDRMSRALFMHHPASRPEYWLYVEDESSQQVVSTLVFIPWTWRYEDVALKSGEVGIVATLEAYRNRGLVRALTKRHHELLREGGFDLSHIQGIPYFYRQFGYEYAMPLEAGWRLELHQIPDTPGLVPLSPRLATVDDIPALIQMYDAGTCALQISAQRTPEIWRYLLERTVGTDTEAETWILPGADGQPSAYWRVARFGFGSGLICNETSRLSIFTAERLIHWLKAKAIERSKPYLRLNLPVSNDLLRAARTWGAHDGGTYAWQMHIPDVARLLRKIGPVLERRISASPFAGLSEAVILNLYREAFELRFEGGKLGEVVSLGYSDQGQIRIPPLLLAPLLLGYRNREELNSFYPDVSVSGQAKALVDVLFPKMDSFIYTQY